MADDPDRDILPVKDCAVYNIPNHKALSSLYEDVAQRQCVSKLRRSDLEDRYLQLCEDNMNLKKQCNNLHEKIKKLATKFLRVVNDRKRALPSTITGNMLGDQQNRIQELETVNDQLQERLLVLKNQLVSHSRLHSAAHFNNCSRSPSRSPMRHPSRPSSRNANIPEPHKTHENLRKGSPLRDRRKVHKKVCKQLEPNKHAKNPNMHNLEEMEVLRNQMNMMEQDMEIMREESNAQITTLEKELAQDKRQQVTDNVEMIRLKRGLKQQSVQLAALQTQNQSTNRDVAAIQEALEQAHKENDNLHNQLLIHKQKCLDMQQEMHKVGTSAESAKELKQALEDLKQEKSTLKAHNDRLLELSASSQAIEMLRNQQMNERDITLRSQVADVQTSLNILLNEKEKLKQALEEEKNMVSSLRQAHQELLSQLLALQNQYAFLEQQQTCSDITEEKDTSPSTSFNSMQRIRYLKQNRKVFKPLLNEKQVLPNDEMSSTNQGIIAARDSGDTPLLALLEAPVSDITAPSGYNAHSTEVIPENPSEGTKCSCSSPSAASCTCCRSSSSATTTSDTRPKPVYSSPPRSEVELMSNYFSNGSHSTAPTQKSTKVSAVFTPEIIQLDKATETMLSSDSQASACSNQPDNVSNKGSDVSTKSDVLPLSNGNSGGVLSDQLMSQGRVCENRSVNLPPETQSQIMPRLSTTQWLFSSEPKSISGAILATEPTSNTSAPTTIQLCNCSNRPYMQEGCKCSRSAGAQETFTNVPDQVTSCQVDSKCYPGGSLSRHFSGGEVNEMAARPTNDTFMATHLDAARELEKCRELLRVQCNLNGLYKQELAKMREQLQYSTDEQNKRITKMCQVVECQAANVPKPQIEKPSFEFDSTLIKKRSLLRVGVGQGLFELHVGYMQLSSEGADRLRSDRSMFLTWKFYDQDVAYTPPKPGPEAQFDCSAVYRVQVDNDFLQYIQKEQCEIHLHASLGDRNELMARGFFSFIELLDFPQNKLHSFVQLRSVDPVEVPVVCGVLQCWYRLSCDVNLISRPKDDQHNEVQGSQLSSVYEALGVVSIQKEDEETFANIVPDDGEQEECISEGDNSEVIPLEQLPTDDLSDENAKTDQEPPPTPPPSPSPSPSPQPSGQQVPIPFVLTQSFPPSKTSLTAVDSSFTSISEEMKSDSIHQTNSKDLTLFQKRMQQLRKGLYSESSSPDIDECDPSTMTELHHNASKSDESIEFRGIPADKENENQKQDSISSEDDTPEQSEKELKDQLTSEIRRSKDGNLLADSETREVLEILDEMSWNRHVHNSNSNTLVQTQTPPDEGRPDSPRAIRRSISQESEKPSEDRDKEPSSSELTVAIHWMTLDPESTPLMNPDIVQLYVEYTFLGMRGSELETAMSLPTPTTADQRLVFNYKKTFDVSAEQHNGRRMELKKLLSRSSLEHSIHFMIISEPLAEDSNTKDCEEIGQASVNLQTMMLEGRDYDPINIAILSVDGRQENIGNLNISIRGVQTLVQIDEPI